MTTAQQVLETKGFDLDQINDIIEFKTKHSEEGFDMQVRTEFNLQDQPVHLLESYYIGDADEDVLTKIANEQGFESAKGMLLMMDERLIQLCEELNYLDALSEKNINDCRFVDCDSFEDFQENADFGQKWEDKETGMIHYKFRNVQHDQAFSVHIENGNIIED